MRRCTNCILPITYPGIQFDSDGRCNICRNFRARQYRGKQALLYFIAPFCKRSGKYDCVVGLSGGRDSTFTLVYVVDELKLRPLALTVENGFMPHETRQNIDNAVRILGVNHVYIPQRLTMGTFSPFLQAWKHRPNPAMIGFLCNGCQGSIKGAVMKATRDNGLNLAISGGGEPQTDFAIQLLKIGTRVLGRRGALVCGTIGQLLSNPLYLRHPSCLTSFAQEGIARYWFRWPENLTRVSPFDFIGWSEDYIVDTIKYRVKWKECANWPTTWRADCKVHWLKEFLYKETLGFTKNDDNLSGMVRQGMITREEALTRLSKFNDLPESYLAEFVAEHGVDFRQLRESCHQWRRSQET